jgi:hypothetical protein
LDQVLWLYAGSASQVEMMNDKRAGTPPFQLFGGVSDDVWCWLHLEGREQSPFLKSYLPGLPHDPESEKALGRL